MNEPLITVVGRLVAVALGDPVFAPEGDHTITVTVEGAGGVSATALWQGSNDKVGWATLATLSPAGTATATAKASTAETYRFWRLNVTALVGSTVTGTVASETSSGGSGASLVSGAGVVNTTAATADAPTASSNRQAIQSAIDAVAASGVAGVVSLQTGSVIYIDQAIQLDDNAVLNLNGATIRQLATSSDNVIVTKAYKRAPVAVTLTWTAGNTMSVQWAGHGLAVGDFACIEPVAIATSSGQTTFVGPFQVRSVTDVNNFVVSLLKTPAAAPTGSWQARKATVNAHVLNGTLDYNSRNGAGGTAGNTPRSMLSILAYAVGCSMEKLWLRDSLKYGVFEYQTASCFVRNLKCDLISDGVHVFGPAFNFVVDGVYGTCGDDSVAVSSRDVTGNWVDVSGGDILGGTVSNVLSKTITACCQIYSHAGYRMEGLRYDQIGGNAPVALNIFGDPTDGGQINDIEMSRISGTGVVSFQIYGGFIANRFSLGRVRFAHRQHNPIVLTDTLFNVGAGVDIGQLVEDYTTVDSGYSASTGGFYLMAVNAAATIRSIDVNGGRFNITDNARMYRIPQNMGLKRFTFRQCTFSRSTASGNVDAVLNLDNTVTENPSINFISCDGTNLAKVLSIKANCRITSSGCSWGGQSGGPFVLVSDAAATAVKLHSAGGNEWGLTPFSVTAGAIEVYGFDLKVDVGAAGLSKTVSGQYCFNNGAARGTLVQNQLVMCDGTNWRQALVPANLF